MIPFYSFLAAVPLLLLADRSAYVDGQPDTRYYVLLFGGQSGLLKPTTGHVWATYVRETGCLAGTDRVEEFTISWLPVTGRSSAGRGPAGTGDQPHARRHDADSLRSQVTDRSLGAV